MSLLAAHLEQISMSCQTIDSLPFPPPKIFTNALLSNHDITSLIRDTEAHERALFSVPPPPPAATSQNPDPPKPSSRRQTVFNVAAGEVTTGPPPNSTRSGPARRNTAVAAVLGGDLHAQIVRRGGAHGHGHGGDGRGDVDIEVLLGGAEKLCTVYPLPGALERIPAQRQRYAQLTNTLAYYEAKVAEQQEALERMNQERWVDEEEQEEGNFHDGTEQAADAMTEEDLRKEEEETRLLDRKKRMLQERLRAMERDLGGLMSL
ncbi:DASH complex subunit Spc34 [Podospora appendiculata]|uniref:DASH complex subunit SPC34 n=1 Tax=Podospora appendiculata TaxID=314037 RepID=A0AAE0XBF3_9PEZI|nr:DASH complex subunit Spc34 [Podospora appendiculata]